MTRIIGLLGLFWGTQIGCILAVKLGSTIPKWWIPSFIASNTALLCSTWVLMLLFKQMNANTAMGLSVGPAFVLSQLAVAWLFHTSLSWLQVVAILLLAAGVCLFSLGELIVRPA